MAPTAASPHRTSIRLEGVEVDYANGRPNKELKLVITVSGQEPVKRKFSRSGAIAWNGNILCPSSSTLTVDVYEKRKSLFWKQTAHFETPLSAIDTSSIPLTDASTAANIRLFFSGFEDTDAMKAERIKEDVKAAREKAEEKKLILEKLDKVRSVISIIKPLGEAVSGIHPVIDAAFAGVRLLIEACENQEASQKAAIALTKEWDGFLFIEDRVHLLKEREGSCWNAAERVLEVIANTANYITNYTRTGVLDDLLSLGYKHRIDELKEKFAKTMDALQLSLQVETAISVGVLEQGRWLDILKPAMETHYKPDGTCLKDTRACLLRKASEWLRGVYQFSTSSAPLSPTSSAKVFWLHGMAGSGKSAVANSVAKAVDDDEEFADFDLSCFFCKRDDPNLSNPQRFFSTLAYRFAQYYDDYRAALVNLLANPNGAVVATGGIKTQFKLLFEDLLPKMTERAHSHVIVVDALDECGTPEDQGELAECILSLAQAAPWIKVFITSRPVPEIHAIFATSIDGCILSNINEEADTDADIRYFVEAKLKDLKVQQKVESTLSSEEIGELVRQAARLFIWASTFFKYVGSSRNPERELRTFLSGEAPREPLQQLYNLYEQVLNSAVNSDNKKDIDVLHAILGSVFVAAGNRPLSAETLSKFLRNDARFRYENRKSVENMTRALHAVLYEDASMRDAVRVYHPSFLDFLQLKLKAGFQFGSEEIHRLVFKGCMATLEAELKFNVCELQDSSLLNKDVPDLNDRVSKCISEALHYSSLFWFAHLSASGMKDDEQAISSVSSLLGTRKVLFWLEVLSLLKAVGQGVAMLREGVLFFVDSAKVYGLASELERFVSMSSEAMESTPHIYLSALAWAPEESSMQKAVAAQFKNVHFITGKGANWEGASWVKAVGTDVYAVAYSPDGRYVAAGLDDHTIRILDSGTGELIGEPLRGHSGLVRSVCFSPDGQHVVSGSQDKSVRIWNAKTGAAVCDPLEGHEGTVNSVCFSPDGLHIASGSSDKTTRIWNAQRNAAVGEPLQGHTGAVLSVAFSPDGQHVLSGSYDQTLRIWDIESGTAIRDPLKGHEGRVWAVCYSPDGQRIASGSEDKTVRIWDARTGATLLEPFRGHTGGVVSVDFSPDGQRIASCSVDTTIRVWNSQTGAAVGEPLRGHYNWIYSVVFSPDGRQIVSGSEDRTIRKWDVRSGAAVVNASEGHSGWVRSVSFSPNGQHVVSGSDDKSVRIWNAKTGAAVCNPLEGHEDAVNSVCFSPDGLHIASGSGDKTIRIWNAQTGVTVGKLLQGHTGAIFSVAISPDGQHVASGSDDRTLHIWDIESGTTIGNPLEGHEGGVLSVCYSPDGQRVASGSEDKTVRIWEARTGAALLEPLHGHTEGVTSVAFSPDGEMIASGSDDGTIRIWNAQTGEAIGEPLKGQSDWINSVAFSPDGRRIVSGSDSDIVRIWHVQKRTIIGEPLRAQSNLVLAVAFSPDGQRIVSGSSDSTVRIWDARIGSVDCEDGSLSDCGVAHRAHWNACCTRMDIADGWVRDGEKLLLWIPYRFRTNFKVRFHVSIKRGKPRIVKPEVDLEKLYGYTGIKWTEVYQP